MINITYNKCKNDNCNKCACFNYKGKKKDFIVMNIKKKNMVNIITKKCKSNGCDKTPLF